MPLLSCLLPAFSLHLCRPWRAARAAVDTASASTTQHQQRRGTEQGSAGTDTVLDAQTRSQGNGGCMGGRPAWSLRRTPRHTAHACCRGCWSLLLPTCLPIAAAEMQGLDACAWQAWGFEEHPVPGDGNCQFHAIAHQLEQHKLDLRSAAVSEHIYIYTYVYGAAQTGPPKCSSDPACSTFISLYMPAQQ